LLGVAAPSSNRSVLKRPRLPCIIKDVEEEYVEAEQSKMFLYPQKKYYQTLANRIMCVVTASLTRIFGTCRPYIVCFFVSFSPSYSQAYIIIYCIMLVLSSLLLGLAIANWEHLAQGYVTVRQNPGFYMLDAVVTLFVLFEVTVRLMGQGVRFVDLCVHAKCSATTHRNQVHPPVLRYLLLLYYISEGFGGPSATSLTLAWPPLPQSRC